MQVLVGSRALAYWNKDFKVNPSTDWDVIGYSSQPFEGIEYHAPSHLNNDIMRNYATNRVVELPDGDEAFVMSMTGLAIMKRSHLWRDLNFDRHITMYHKFGLAGSLQVHEGVSQVSYDLAYRTQLTKEVYKQWKPKLNVSKEEFFDDAVVKYYDHDYLHELVANVPGKPMYREMLEDGQEVLCSQEKWSKLGELRQTWCVVEETEVIAIERFMIPSNWTYNPSLAYCKALSKVCTTLTSGWFRDFAIDNYPVIMQYRNPEKLMKLKSVLPLPK